MTETTTTTTTAPAPAAAKAKRTQGDLDKQLLADIQLGEDIAEAAVDPAHAPMLAEEDVDGAEVTNLTGLTTAARNLAAQAVAAKKSRLAATKAETAAQKKLLSALRDLQSRAKRKFAKDKIRQAAYGIGKKNFGKNRTEFEQDADNIVRLAGTDALPGLKPEKLAAATAALTAWKSADTAQAQANETQSKLLIDLQAKVTDLNAARRDIQLAANTAWPHDNQANTATRRAFKIPANKPMAV